MAPERPVPVAPEAAATPSAEPPPDTDALEPDRPSDADIIRQENAIREAEAHRAFLGDKELLDTLQREYRDGSEVFQVKIAGLKRFYRHIRRTRGDGNCFFRSFIFAYLEDLLDHKRFEERHRVTATIKEMGDKLRAAGFENLVFEDSQDLLLEQLNAIHGGDDALTKEDLLVNMRNESLGSMIIAYLRLATSAEIGSRADFFAPFVMGISVEEMTVEQFRRRCVEPMGEESDEVHIVALTDVLQVPIRVLYLDRSVDSGDPQAVNHHDFVPEALQEAVRTGAAKPSAAEPRVHLLYRPGHYDILYPELALVPSTADTTPRAAEGPAAEGQQQEGALDQAAVSSALAAAIAAFNNPAAGQQPAAQ